MRNNRSLQHRPLALAIVLITLATASGVTPIVAHAQESISSTQAANAQTKRFDIAAGSLSQVLSQFAGAAGVALSFDSAEFSNIQSSGLKGSYSIDQGFAILLADTGTTAVRQKSGDYVLRKTQATLLPPVKVAGRLGANQLSHVGSKLPLEIREIPHTVTVIGHERLEQQNLHSMEDVIRKVPGMTVERIDGNRFNLYSRGFEVTRIQLDGLSTRLDDRLFLSPDMTMYERVEILKGPAGLFSGSGTPGGTINLQRKKPLADFALSGKVSAGSWDNYRTNIDLGGPLNSSGSLRGRAVGAFQDRQFFYDIASEESQVFYGSLAFDITQSTSLNVGAAYHDMNARGTPWTLPGFIDFSLLNVNRSTALGADWNRGDYTTTQLFIDLEHRLSNGWLIKLSALHLDNDMDRRETYAWGAVDPQDNLTTLYSTGFDDRQEQTLFELYAIGPFSLFDREHQLLLGANHEATDFEQRDFAGDTGMPFGQITQINVFDPPRTVPRPNFIPDGGKKEETTEYGFYSNLRLQISDPLSWIIGARLSRWDQRFQPFGGTAQTDDLDTEVTPVTGIVYDLNPVVSLYASYAEIFQPQDARDRSGQLLEPLVGQQYEFGVKGEFFGGDLTATAALFRIKEKNRAQADINDPSGDAYVAQGKARSQGLDVEISGQPRPGWDLSIGYTYTDTENLDDSENQEAAFSAVTPKHSFRLWSHYAFSGQWQPLSLGLGINTVSKFYNKFGNERFTQSGYTTVDTRIAYKVNRHMEIDISITNLLDEKYFQRISDPNSGNLFGEPRAYAVSLRVDI